METAAAATGTAADATGTAAAVIETAADATGTAVAVIETAAGVIGTAVVTATMVATGGARESDGATGTASTTKSMAIASARRGAWPARPSWWGSSGCATGIRAT